MQTEINLKLLKGVALFTNTAKDGRGYLRGVLVECRPEHVTYVATSGTSMVVARETFPTAPDSPLVGDWIIPVTICNAWTPHAMPPLGRDMLSRDGNQLRLVISGLVFSPVDGQFPDWRRVVPWEKPTGATAQFHPELVGRFHKFNKLQNSGLIPSIAHNGTSAALVRLDTDSDNIEALGLLMPFRNEVMPVVPAWVRGEGAAQQAAE